MNNEQRNFLHDIVAEILKLPLNRVIWAYQSKMPRQQFPFVLLRLWGAKSEAQEEFRDTDIDVIKKIFVPTSILFEVQYFAGYSREINPQGELEKLVRRIEDPNIVDRFFKARLAVYDSESVQDLTELIDGQTYEYRAAVELRVRYNSEIEADLGAIEEVHVSGKTALIHGKISKDGAVDLNHSLPVNFKVRS